MTNPLPERLDLSAAEANLLIAWWFEASKQLRSFHDEVASKPPSLQTLHQASWLGLRARTDPALLNSLAWKGILESLPTRPPSPRSREQAANALARELKLQCEACQRAFDAHLQAFLSTDQLPGLGDPDPVIQTVDRIDALARAAVGVSWLIDGDQPVEAMQVRQVLEQVEQFLKRVGNRADCLAVAQERLEAMVSTISESVLSSDAYLSMRQSALIGQLPNHEQAVRRSALWLANAAGRVYWAVRNAEMRAAAISESGSDESAADDPYDLVAALRRRAQGLVSSELERDAAVVAARILSAPPLLAAADAGVPRPNLRLTWVSPDEERVATCSFSEGDATAVIRIFRGDDLDASFSGISVTCLGIASTADQGLAKLDLRSLSVRGDDADRARELADRVSVLWVGEDQWLCESFELIGS
ncbi:MAG: hypothetical protein FJ246_11130 [Nitrospira sp.]|nr:hypothetical protein [Nitrospira sp.]